MEDRGEIDARRMRCKDAELKPERHDVGFPPTPGMEEAVKIVERGIAAGTKKTYDPDGRYLKKFRDMKHALRAAVTAQEYDDALIALIRFTADKEHQIIADIRAGMVHEELG